MAKRFLATSTDGLPIEPHDKRARKDFADCSPQDEKRRRNSIPTECFERLCARLHEQSERMTNIERGIQLLARYSSTGGAGREELSEWLSRMRARHSRAE